MAINIYLRSLGPKQVDITSLEELEVVRLCVKDYQLSLGLVSKGKFNSCISDDSGAKTTNRFIVDLADECNDYSVAVKDSHIKRSFVFNYLKESLRTTTPLPNDELGEHFIENPLLTNKELKLKHWTIGGGGIYNDEGKGNFIPNMWFIVYPIDTIFDYLRQRLDSSRDEGIKDAMSLLSECLDATLELNSQCVRDRKDEIKRKFNSLATLIRTVMEESEENNE